MSEAVNVNTSYLDLFDELKEEVKAAGLLERIPVRGSIEMIAIIVSFIIVFTTIALWSYRDDLIY